MSKFTQTHQADSVSVQKAVVALHGFKRQNIQGINPADPLQLRACITLRETMNRVTPEQFLNFLKSQTASVSSGAETTQSFWAVPKCNFAELPPDIAANLVSPIECDGLLIDHDKFYVVDQRVARTSLGRNVWMQRKYSQHNNAGDISAPAGDARLSQPALPQPALPQPALPQPVSPPAASSRVAWPAAALVAGAGSNADAGGAGAGGTVAIRSLKRYRSDGSAHGDWTVGDPHQETAEAAAVRRARPQQETLSMLRDSMLNARKSNNWTHRPGSLKPDSVLHWATRLVKCLEELAVTEAVTGEDHCKRVADSFLVFLSSMLVASACYLSLCEFKGIFLRMMPLAGEHLDVQKEAECLLIEQLAGIDPNGDQVIHAEDVSVFVSEPFFSGKCYHSFVEHRGDRTLTADRNDVC